MFYKGKNIFSENPALADIFYCCSIKINMKELFESAKLKLYFQKNNIETKLYYPQIGDI